MLWDMGFSALLATLLIATIVAAVRLDRALRAMRRDRGVFETLVSNLASANDSVGVGIQALRQEADRAARQVAQRVEQADKIATDLSFLVDAADGAGSRLEARLHDVRSLTASRSGPHGATSLPVESRLVRSARILRKGVAVPWRGSSRSPDAAAGPPSAPADLHARRTSADFQGSSAVLLEVPFAASEPYPGPLLRAGITVRRRTAGASA